MDDLFMLSAAQMRRIEPFFPLSHGVPRVDDRLTARGITLCIPPKSNRKVQYHYDKAVYKKRHLVENLFAKLKDWRRIHTRYDRCAHTFMSAICVAATVIFWL